MDNPSTRNVTCRTDAKNAYPYGGFSLLEMMMVVTLILIIASIASPMEAVSSQFSALSLQRAC